MRPFPSIGLIVNFSSEVSSAIVDARSVVYGKTRSREKSGSWTWRFGRYPDEEWHGSLGGRLKSVELAGTDTLVNRRSEQAKEQLIRALKASSEMRRTEAILRL